ncbi:hypothetical protein PMZ80_010754 [Knufia obscura]|uniref:MYB DNA-binding domain-containing protein n=2 Tax=Knufia TaxID=430999 RepID=A0AAN8I4D8_9EURO|nr:hypothetical protein PMZ80_010754 [Knufia obscura]KAK5949790.1 hypothetical protein OHC33_009179 [Knufia fluminis]
MSVATYQPNLPTSSYPCGQSWHQSSNVDISLLLKPKDDEASSRSRPSPPPSLTRSDSAPSSVAAQSASSRTLASTSTVIPAKRGADRTSTLASESPAKKQSKWSAEEDAKIIQLRGEGMKWEDISKHLPGRSAISCRLHYQNYLERRSEWDEDRKNKLARLYERFKADMWAKIAEEMAIPWRAAEAMHWQMGEHEMARRAGVTPFTLTNPNHNSISRLSNRPPTSRPRGNSASGPQQLPSLAELTAGLPAYSHPHSTPGYPFPDRTPGTPYSTGLPYPGRQSLTPPPGSLQQTDYFLRRP